MLTNDPWMSFRANFTTLGCTIFTFGCFQAWFVRTIFALLQWIKGEKTTFLSPLVCTNRRWNAWSVKDCISRGCVWCIWIFFSPLHSMLVCANQRCIGQGAKCTDAAQKAQTPNLPKQSQTIFRSCGWQGLDLKRSSAQRPGLGQNPDSSQKLPSVRPLPQSKNTPSLWAPWSCPSSIHALHPAPIGGIGQEAAGMAAIVNPAGGWTSWPQASSSERPRNPRPLKKKHHGTSLCVMRGLKKEACWKHKVCEAYGLSTKANHDFFHPATSKSQRWSHSNESASRLL